MKRFHLHVNVADLDASIAFYSHLFASAPGVRKSDYTKWMLEDPRLNFAISTREGASGIDHLGIQAEDGAELRALGDRLHAADAVRLAESNTTCCYAHSDKFWAEDPQGVRWEGFHTHGVATTYSAAPAEVACCTPVVDRVAARASACCGPNAATAEKCG